MNKVMKQRIIRGLLTGALLYYVWRGDMWAIKLSITLLAIGVELTSWVIGEEL